MPPATDKVSVPSAMADAARVTALRPEEQTLLIVVQSAEKERPALTAA